MTAVAEKLENVFKELKVAARKPIKKVLDDNKLDFQKGRCYYQLTKPEIIQDYKGVIVRRKTDGKLITGEAVRAVLDIPSKGPAAKKRFMLDLDTVPDFQVFIQSTSHNRVMIPDTMMLYRTDEKDDADVVVAKKGSKARGATVSRGRSTRAAAKTAAGTLAKPAPAAKPKKTPVTKPKKPAASKAKKKPAATKPKKPVAIKAKAKPAKTKNPRAGKVTPSKPAVGGMAGKPAVLFPTKKPKKGVTPPKKAGGLKRKATEMDGEGEFLTVERSGPVIAAKKSTATRAPPAPPTSAPLAPTPKRSKRPTDGGVVEVVFSFDTTGSMYPCLAEVRRGITSAIQRLKRDVPGIRIAIIAHGDYCDSSNYVTKIQDFSENESVLCNFVRNVSSTGGGDADECYELVLREARTKLSWTPDSTRSLVMIGDCNPHMPSYVMNVQNIDWREECHSLKAEGIRVYAVQALNRSEATTFYRTMASLTDGFHLHLSQFASVVNFMMAICYSEEGGETLDMFETEVRAGPMGRNRELHNLFDTLQGRAPSAPEIGVAREDGLVPVDPSRFQVLHVNARTSIREFVQENSLIFKTGRGFYEFTKPEIISHKKEVVLVDKVTGDMFTGPEACAAIGAGGAGRIKPTFFDQWRVFVQSTSYNRALVADTGFLYEVDPDF